MTRIIHQNLQTQLLLLHLERKGKYDTSAKNTEQKADQTHNPLDDILVFVRESYLFCDSCIYCDNSINNIIRVVKYEYDEYLKL